MLSSSVDRLLVYMLTLSVSSVCRRWYGLAIRHLYDSVIVDSYGPLVKRLELKGRISLIGISSSYES
jgi:hypothetical protein